MRDDLKLAAYAVACGFALRTDSRREPGAAIAPRHFIRGVPHDGLQFTLGPVEVWQTARGWRCSMRGDDGRHVHPAPPEQFHASLLPALEHARGLALKAAEERPQPDGQAALVAAALHSADDISARIVAGNYRATLSDVEELRNHVRRLAAALGQPGQAKPVANELPARSIHHEPDFEGEGPAAVIVDALALLDCVERAECFDGAWSGFFELEGGGSFHFGVEAYASEEGGAEAGAGDVAEKLAAAGFRERKAEGFDCLELDGPAGTVRATDSKGLHPPRADDWALCAWATGQDDEAVIDYQHNDGDLGLPFDKALAECLRWLATPQ